MPTLTHPGSGPPSLGRFSSLRSTVLPFGSVVTPAGTDGHVEAAAQGTAVTSALPTGVIDGDLILIEVAHGSGGPPGTTITTPTGWNLLSNIDDGSAKAPVFWRFFVGGDAAPSFTLGTSRSWVTRSTAFRNVDQVHPFGPFDSDYRQVAQASGGTYTTATITPGEDGALVVACFGGKVSAGVFQTISTAVGWLPTGAISQSSIAAVVNVWAHFQYQPQSVMAPVSEIVTITDSAVGSATIVALRPTGLPAPPMRFGTIGIALHPGRGPSNVGRFWGTPRSTDIAVGGAGVVTADGAIPAAATISADAIVIQLATASIPATGSIAGTGATIAIGTATVPAAGSIAAAATLIQSATGAVPATGTISAVALVVQLATAIIPATGSITATVAVIRPATATLPATGSITATGVIVGSIPNVTRWDTGSADLAIHDQAGAASSTRDTGAALVSSNDSTAELAAGHENSGGLVGSHEGA